MAVVVVPTPGYCISCCGRACGDELSAPAGQLSQCSAAADSVVRGHCADVALWTVTAYPTFNVCYAVPATPAIFAVAIAPLWAPLVLLNGACGAGVGLQSHLVTTGVR